MKINVGSEKINTTKKYAAKEALGRLQTGFYDGICDNDLTDAQKEEVKRQYDLIVAPMIDRLNKIIGY